MSRTRTATLEGRPHIVSEVVMLREGVFEGSQGPILYPAAELAKSAVLWNGRPLTHFHPEQYGSPYAGDPRIFDARRIGTVFNSRWDSSRRALVAEAWIDPAAAQRIDPDFAAALAAGRPVEVSTGLFFDHDGVPGAWAGKPFDGTATNYRPDHLATLVGIAGACSLADGCGLLAA